ncbi:MAG: zeta toxin family protein, partial [Firmicutes bacterium]|nr:zeta toxin family protein [Bacillota bacterium]
MKDAIIIGIAGGTGCGKSTLIRKIKEEFNDDICILSHDFYYKQRNDIPFEERK